MLTELRISSLGVIDDAVVHPASGLTVVTGETGAGKTMIVTGLGLIAGAKADAGLIRRGAERALVEAVFADIPSEVAVRVAELGALLDQGELLVARHVLGARSRSYLGGTAQPNATVGELTAELLTLHGQSEQIRLGTPERQREVLDRAGGEQITQTLGAYREAWRRRQAAIHELASLTQESQVRARELDILTFGLTEIEKADPQPGEDAELAMEALRLQAVDDLRLAAHTASVALSGDDTGIDDVQGALGLIGGARKALGHSADSDPALAALLQRLQEANFALTDVAADLTSYLADLDADPARLETIAARRAQLQTLTRKYGDDIDAVLAWAAEAAVRVGELAGSDERIELLRSAITRLDGELTTYAAELTSLRSATAERLAAATAIELKALAMPHARVVFLLEPLDSLGPWGAESISLLFSANPGSAPAPLAKVASGGELSRVRLALEVVLADAEGCHTFIFDEVDAGVGGVTGTQIGRRLAALSQRAQVIVVSHLAQVAAFADRHIVVSKTSDGQVTTSGIRVVEGNERLAELARMMGGSSSATALAHARELLAQATP